MSETTTSTDPTVNATPSEPEAGGPPDPAPAPGGRRKKVRAARRAAEPAPAASPRAQRSGADGKASRRATSDVGVLRSFGLAIPFYAAALWGAKVAPPSAREILLERGWPPHATMIIASLAFAILLLKTAGLWRQRRAFALDLLPEGAPRIGPEDAARLLAHVESIRKARGPRSFLVERVHRVLAQYAARGDVTEASAANDADAEADAGAVAASFSTVKVLVWAMPILGLIGTVIGLSGAVGAFSHAMSGAEQLDSIKDSLRQVTTGLAVAFDATFVALVASILVMLPLTWLQKGEDQLVNDVDDYTITHILSRLGTRGAEVTTPAEQPATPALDAGEVRKILVEAIAAPLAEMLSANARVLERLSEERLGLAGAEGALVGQLSGFAATLEQAAPALERATSQLERTTAAVGPSLDRATAELGRATAEMGSGVERVIAELDRSTAAVGPGLDRAMAGLDRTASQVTEGMERALTQLERATAQMETRVSPSVERAATHIDRAVTQLEATTAVADQAATAAERAQDQLSRELGASRQLLSLLAAGLGAGEGAPARPRHANGANGAGGPSAAREA